MTKMKTTDTKLTKSELEVLEWLKDCPTTEEVLEKLKQMEPLNLDKDPNFVVGCMYGQITEGIFDAMHDEGINQKQLAERLGKSPGYVSRIMNETAAMDLKKLANIAIALNRKVEIRLINHNNP